MGVRSPNHAVFVLSRPPLLLVVGMHRSGTSLLGGILKRLGVGLPGETISGDHHNPEGYFEWADVVDLQERLLIDLDRWWPAPAGTLALPDGWIQHPATRKVYGKLLELVAAAVDQQQGLWAIKDPRCSRLIPLWIMLCRDLAIPLRLLLAVRDPVEVITSLVRRDGPLVGMDPIRAQQLWWRHNLEVVKAAQQAELPLAVVDFDRWFEAPDKQLQVLEKSCPELRPSPDQRQQALALIKPQHRRSLRSDQVHNLQNCVRRLHRRLLRKPLPDRWPALKPPFGLTVATEAISALNMKVEKSAKWKAFAKAKPCWKALPRSSQPRPADQRYRRQSRLGCQGDRSGRPDRLVPAGCRYRNPW